MQMPDRPAGNCPGSPKADRGSLPAQCALGRHVLGWRRRSVSQGQPRRVSLAGSASPGQLARNQVLLNPPEPLIALVESLSAPLLLIMMISVGLCEPSEVPLAAETL